MVDIGRLGGNDTAHQDRTVGVGQATAGFGDEYEGEAAAFLEGQAMELDARSEEVTHLRPLMEEEAQPRDPALQRCQHGHSPIETPSSGPPRIPG